MPKITKVEPVLPTIKQKKKVAAYARISMESERMSHSLSAQVSYYSSLIQKNQDWEYAGVFADNGISGTDIVKRTEFQRMIVAADNGEIDIILTKSIQRFARNTVDLLETVRHLKNIGVEVRFEKENINSLSDDGELLLSILASFAQEESVSISNNVKWGIKKRFEQGIPNGHFRIYGYRWEGDQMVIVPEEAAIVKRIFQNFLDGKSRLETEREFAAKGITTRDGYRWVDSNIRQVLTNISYTGNMLLQKEYVESPLTHKRKKNRGEMTQYWVENTHEPIIDRATFDYVQEEMARRRELGPLANKSLNTSCFTGKIKCEKCGLSFVRNTRTNRAKMSQLGEMVTGWVCGSTKKKGSHCKANEIPEPILMRECAKALGLEEFDERVFSERVEKIIIPKHGIMMFYFKDGTSLRHEWVNTSKRDCWTDEYKAKASAYRRNHAINRKDITCFTTKIKCVHCGCNFRKQISKSSGADGKKYHHWRCAEHNGCTTVGIRDDRLRNMTAEVLGINEFDESVFKEQIDHIDVLSASEIVFCLKNGKTVSRTWEQPKRVGKPWTEEQRAKFKESIKASYTPERRKAMSEHMKQLRKERGRAWRKEE